MATYTNTQFKKLLRKYKHVFVASKITPNDDILIQITKNQAIKQLCSQWEFCFYIFLDENKIVIDGLGDCVSGKHWDFKSNLEPRGDLK